MFLQFKARLAYWLARRLFHWSWFVRQPRGWRWLEGQFARMANLGDVGAQSFYGHILTFRGVGLGAREEGCGCCVWRHWLAMAKRPIRSG